MWYIESIIEHTEHTQVSELVRINECLVHVGGRLFLGNARKTLELRVNGFQICRFVCVRLCFVVGEMPLPQCSVVSAGKGRGKLCEFSNSCRATMSSGQLRNERAAYARSMRRSVFRPRPQKINFNLGLAWGTLSVLFHVPRHPLSCLYVLCNNNNNCNSNNSHSSTANAHIT